MWLVGFKILFEKLPTCMLNQDASRKKWLNKNPAYKHGEAYAQETKRRHGGTRRKCLRKLNPQTGQVCLCPLGSIPSPVVMAHPRAQEFITVAHLPAAQSPRTNQAFWRLPGCGSSGTRASVHSSVFQPPSWESLLPCIRHLPSQGPA